MSNTPLNARRRPGDERGAVLVLAAVGLVVAILAAAMAIDVGSVIWRKRDLQVVADLAATDTAQQLGAAIAPITLPMAQQLAQESATRNGFDFAASGNSIVALLGTFDPALDPAFVPVADPAMAEAVMVTAVRRVPYNFAPGANTVTTKAVASFGDEPRAAFSIGSKLASLDARSSNVLGPVLTSMLGVSPALTANAVTYEGLASSNVTLGDLSAQMGFATVDEMLAGNVTVPELADASAKILDREGTADASVVTALFDIAADSNLNTVVAFGDMVDVEQGQGDAAASMGLNVLDLLTSAGQRVQIANGNTFLTVPLNVAIPGLVTGPDLANATLHLDLIQPPVISAFGPIGTQATTAQIGMALTTRIQVQVPPVCLPIVGCAPSALSLDLQLPIELTAAGGNGEITDIDCTIEPPETPVEVTVDTFGATASTDARLTAKALGLTLLNGPIAGADVPVAPGTGQVLTFPGGADPMPMAFPSAIQSTPGGRALASDLVTNLRLDLISGLDLSLALGLLTQVTSLLDSVILNPVFDALGLSVGGADVRSLAVECPGQGGQLVQ